MFVQDGSNTWAYVPLGGYVSSHEMTTSVGLHDIALDDSGYVYGVTGTGNLYICDPINWVSASGTLSVTLDVGSEALLQHFALYSPGNFTGIAPL